MNEIDPDKKDERAGQDFGEYKPYSGNIIDPKFVETANSDLESMYVKPTASKVATMQRRVNMESQEKTRLGGCAIWGIAFLVLVGAGVGLLAVTKNTVLDTDGDETEVSNLQWLLHFTNRSPRVAMLEGFAEDYRRYFITVERLELVNSIAEGIRSSGERMLRPEQMAAKGMLNEKLLLDGWGYPIEIVVEGATLQVISGGEDHLTRNADDVKFVNGQLDRPPKFMMMEMDRETPGGRR